MRGILFAVLGMTSTGVGAWYLPGIAVHDYEPSEQVWLKINSLTSAKRHVPEGSYDFNFCKPKKVVDVQENFGEFLSGDRIQNSPYKIFALEDSYCNVLCGSWTGAKKRAQKTIDLIKNDYHHNWILDNLPAAAVKEEMGSTTTLYAKGVPVGFESKEKFYINNHVTLIIKYHSTDVGTYRIVGLYAEAFSVKHAFTFGDKWTPYKKGGAEKKATRKANAGIELATCDGSRAMTSADAAYLGPQEYVAKTQIVFAYDVVWEPSEVRWASRWDIYLSTGSPAGGAVHWFAIVNALVVVVSLGALLALALYRSLRADLQRYNAAAEERERMVGTGEGRDDGDESGWKMLHADVFRPPRNPLLFCAVVASGAQLVAVGSIVFAFAYVGFLSPANRGALVVALFAAYALCGGLAGYVGAALYKGLGGKRFSATAAAIAGLFPGACAAVFVALDVGLLAAKSAGAAPVVVLLQLAGLYFAVAVPLVYLGAAAGFGRDALEWPAKPAARVRAVPPQSPAMALPVICAVAGAVPFGAAFVELYFALDAVWMEAYYYVMGFSSIAFLLLVLAAAECGALATYYTLVAEDHGWMWRSFLAPATAGAYVFAYAAYYYFTKLDGDAFSLTFCLYFGYMGLASVAVALVAGAAGFAASYKLTRAIYAAVKFD